MNSRDPADADLVTLPSAHGASETIERLKSLLAHNPQAGTPLMQSQQTIGLDLPLRVLVWEPV
jgi:uncharacterized protein (DUF302 family)